MVNGRPTLFLDFDGTITSRDATDAILEAYADPAWRDVEEAWQAGQIGSRECLRRQMSLVAASPSELDTLLDGIGIDDGFAALLDLKTAYGLPLHIVSDGFDYCIRRILRRPSLDPRHHIKEITIASSQLLSTDGGWKVEFPHGGCAHGCATCKPAVMAAIAGSGFRIFVGDGLSDRHAAAAADLVFAKDKLAAHCDHQAISYVPFDNLAAVAAHLESLLCGGTAGLERSSYRL